MLFARHRVRQKFLSRLIQTMVGNGERNGMETEIREEEQREERYKHRARVHCHACVGQRVIKSKKHLAPPALAVQEEAPDISHDTGWIFNGWKHSGA